MKYTETPSSAKPATSMPVTAPDLKAMSRPPASDFDAACAVRTLARTETFMPMKPARPESTAPTKKPTATVQLNRKPSTRRMMTPTTAIVAYCRLR